MKFPFDQLKSIVEDHDKCAALLKDWEKENERRKRNALVEELLKKVVMVYPKGSL